MTHWSAQELKDGIRLRIPVDNAREEELPSIATGHPAADLMFVNWKQRPFLRAYEHEILVVAPADEATIGQEQGK